MSICAKGNRRLSDPRFTIKADPRRWRRCMSVLRVRILRQVANGYLSSVPPLDAKTLGIIYRTGRKHLLRTIAA